MGGAVTGIHPHSDYASPIEQSKWGEHSVVWRMSAARTEAKMMHFASTDLQFCGAI
jgi:hypothetical protein